MKKKLKFGFIGLGSRGVSLINDVLIPMAKEEEIIEIAAICDLYEDRMEKVSELLRENGCSSPVSSRDYRDILNIADIDAIVVTAAWEAHVDIAVAAMKAGKYVGIEVGGAYDIEDCWKLVNASEETGVHCMFLENCCYGRRELMTLNMVRLGVLGDIVHCEGGYLHDLREEVSCGEENRHYRLRNYIHRNCDNYPTHELGPIAKLLDINNGNRFVSLTSTASCSKGLHEYICATRKPDDPLINAQFAQGDIITTVLKTYQGQTVTLVLDTTLPRTYSRGFTVRGTKGSYSEDTDCVFLDSDHSHDADPRSLWGNAEEYAGKYDHPLWKNNTHTDGHGGIDWIVFHAFYEAVSKNVRPPIDVYDAALYMSITPLSEQSILTGSAPVQIPDFTRGKWYMRSDIAELEHRLDR